MRQETIVENLQFLDEELRAETKETEPMDEEGAKIGGRGMKNFVPFCKLNK